MGLRFDPSASTIVIETFAEGLLSAFAHDMRLEARNGSGESADEDRIELRFPVTGLTAVESSKKGKHDYHPISTSDGRDVESRIRSQVFPGVDTVRVEAVRAGSEAHVVAQRRARARLSLRVEERDGGLVVEGEGTLSLSELGAGKVSVPMGAMKLKDEVRVRVKARFTKT
jgi:hypothetical protein